MFHIITHSKLYTIRIPVLFLLVGCGATNVEWKTTGGVGLGALAGGLITGDVRGAVAGAAVSLKNITPSDPMVHSLEYLQRDI